MASRRRLVLGSSTAPSATGALSVGDTRYSASVALTLGKPAVLRLTLDQANNRVGVAVDGGSTTWGASVGTHNAQTGSLVMGAQLVDGAAQSGSAARSIGYLHSYSSILSGSGETAAWARAAKWLAPVLTAPASFQVTSTGTTVFTVTSYVQDPAAYGWQITSATSLTTGLTVASTTSTTVSLTTSLAIGTAVSFRVRVRSNHPLQPFSDLVVGSIVVAATSASGYRYSRRIIVPAARVSGSTALANYILLVRETNDSFKTVALGGRLQTDGILDVRFETTGGTQLPHRIITSDTTAGTIVARVRLTSLSASADNEIVMRYGATISEAETDPVGVYADAGYLHVVDLANGTDLIEGRAAWTTQDLTVDGEDVIFNGSTSFVRQADNTSMDGNTAWTWLLEMQPGAAMDATDRGYFASGAFNGNDQDHAASLHNAQNGLQGGASKPIVWATKVGTGTARYESAANAHFATRKRVAACWSNGALPKLYFNGVVDVPTWVGSAVGAVRTQNGTLSGVTTAPNTGPIVIGAGHDGIGAGSFSGRMWSEFRVMTTEPTADFLLTENRNQDDPQTFYGLGGEDAAGDSTSAPVALPIAVAAAAGVLSIIDVLAVADDPDGSLTITDAGSPSGGSATVIAAKINYTPGSNFSGTDRWSYTISDGSKTSTGYIIATVTGAETPDNPTELPTPVRSITGINTYAKLAAYVTGTGANRYTDPVHGLVTPTAGDHVFLASVAFTGANMTVGTNISGTEANPIVFRATSLLDTSIRFKLIAIGTDQWFWGLKFDPDTASTRTGRLQVYGVRQKFLRCEITGWTADPPDGTEGYGIQLGAPQGTNGGSDAYFGYCLIHNPGAYRGDEINNTGNQSLRMMVRTVAKGWLESMENATFDRCIFAGTIKRPAPDSVTNPNVRYGYGQSDLFETGGNGPNFPQNPTRTLRVGLLVKDCLFDGTGAYTGYTGEVDLAPSGVVDNKIAGVTYQGCTFTNMNASTGTGKGYNDLRYGQSSRFEGCWFTATTGGIRIYGGEHVVAGCVLKGGALIDVLRGDVEWTDYSTNNHQRAHNVRLTNNEGIVHVGDDGGIGATAILPAENTLIEANTGVISTGSGAAGSVVFNNGKINASTPGDTGTSIVSTVTETVTRPTAPLTPGQVGPFAALGGFALGPDYTDNWTLFTNTGATISQTPTGVTLTADNDYGGAGPDDGEHIMLVSNDVWTGDFIVSMTVTRRDNATGSDQQESGLFYFLMTGDGSSGHPADIRSWAGADGSTRFEYNSTGFRMAFDPRTSPVNANDGQVRLRYFPGGGDTAGTQILQASDYPTGSTKFPFALDDICTVTVKRQGTTFTFTKQSQTGPVTSKVKTHASLDDANSGRFIIRMMAGRSFQISNFIVQTP